ncbi:MAG: MarR family winged helix-turn-helix transcriptional regulator [Hyphomicrobiales bacterium]
MQQELQDPDLVWNHPRFRNWIEVPKAYQIARRLLSDGLATIDLDLPRYDVLATILRFPGLTQQELADKLLIGRSNLSMLLPDMEKKSYLERLEDAADRRLKRLFLTSAGEDLARSGLRIHVKAVNHMMEPSSEEECRVLGEQMRKIRKHIQQRPPPEW